MNLLVKYPTRQRPELFLKTLKEYHDKAFCNAQTTYLVSYDLDDLSMTHEVIKEAKRYGNVMMIGGSSDNKIHACNRDMDYAKNWDVVLLISDDMEVQKDGWDATILMDMDKYYPNGDGVLWYHDGSKQRVITTLTCMDKKYYSRFGFLYNPIYKSFFCDNEFTDIARKLNKIKFIDNVIIKHQHPQWGGKVKHDELYERNNAPWKEDQNTYETRKRFNFGLI